MCFVFFLIIEFSLFSALCTSPQLNDNDTSSKSWLKKLMSRKITKSEASKEAHSSMLSDKEIVYALHTHNIRTDSVDKYLKN